MALHLRNDASEQRKKRYQQGILRASEDDERATTGRATLRKERKRPKREKKNTKPAERENSQRQDLSQTAVAQGTKRQECLWYLDLPFFSSFLFSSFSLSSSLLSTFGMGIISTSIRQHVQAFFSSSFFFLFFGSSSNRFTGWKGHITYSTTFIIIRSGTAQEFVNKNFLPALYQGRCSHSKPMFYFLIGWDITRHLWFRLLLDGTRALSLARWE
jgi:hypothetical protein